MFFIQEKLHKDIQELSVAYLEAQNKKIADKSNQIVQIGGVTIARNTPITYESFRDLLKKAIYKENMRDEDFAIFYISDENYVAYGIGNVKDMCTVMQLMYNTR